MKYKLRLKRGVPVVSVGEYKYIIDTGSPSSLTNNGVIIIGENKYEAQKNVSLDNIGKKIDCKIDGLAGNDILSKFKFVLDYKNQYCILNCQENVLSEKHIIATKEVSMKTRVPVIEINLGRRAVNAIFDTGADISYVADSANYQQFKTKRVFNDFNPMVGDFSTQVFEIPVSIVEGKSFIGEFGSFDSQKDRKSDAVEEDGIGELVSKLGGEKNISSMLEKNKDNSKISSILNQLGGSENVMNMLSSLSQGNSSESRQNPKLDALVNMLKAAKAEVVIGQCLLKEYVTLFELGNNKVTFYDN